MRAGPCLPAQLAESLLPRGARGWQWGLREPPDWALAPDRVREREHGSLACSCLSICPPVQEVPASPRPHPAWAGGRAWGALGWAQSKGLLFLLTCRTDWLLTDRLLLRVLGRMGGWPGLKTLSPSPRGGPVAGRGEGPERGLLGAWRGHRRWGAARPTQVARGPEGRDGSASQAAGVSEQGGPRTGPHPGGKSPELWVGGSPGCGKGLGWAGVLPQCPLQQG